MLLSGAPALLAGQSTGGMFLPHDWVRGYVDAALAPPHNEPDLNRCASTTGVDGGAHAACAAFARYTLGGYLELQPIGATPLRRVFLFAQPKVFLGSNVPQFAYTASAAPIAYESILGVGVALPKHFELRLTHHRIDWMGRYQSPLGRQDLHTTGPLGLYTTVSARWYFGGYARRDSE
jgi:hypothetical protein